MYKKILMPVDVFEMDLSDKAVRHAVNLAKAEGATITLVNILPNSSRSLLRGFNADIKKFEEYMTAESDKKMKALKRLFDMSRTILTVKFASATYAMKSSSSAKRGNMMSLLSDQKIRALQHICWVQMLKLFCATPLFRY